VVRGFFATKAGETSRRRWGRDHSCCERRGRGQHVVRANLPESHLFSFFSLFGFLSFQRQRQSQLSHMSTGLNYQIRYRQLNSATSDGRRQTHSRRTPNKYRSSNFSDTDTHVSLCSRFISPLWLLSPTGWAVGLKVLDVRINLWMACAD